MLLAAVGQTPLASYAQHSSTTTVAGTTSAKSKGTQNQQNLGSRNQQQFQARSLLAVTNSNHNSFSRPTTVTAATAASSLMKTLSVRLHRGTEYIKDTVQRALVVSSAANAGCSASNIPSTSAKAHGAGHRSSLQRPQAIPSTTALRSSVPSASFLKLYTVPPTTLHRSTQARQNAGSTDSLLKELCHFKPIRPMPLTPIQMSIKPPGCDVKCPKAIYATHRFALKFPCDDTKLGSSLSNPCASPVVKDSPLSTTILTTTPQHKSAFVCLIHRVDLKPNTDAGAKVKKTKRRRRNVFSLPRRRARQNTVKCNAIVTIDEVTIQNTNPTPVITSTSKTVEKVTEQPHIAGKRKRKHVEASSLNSQSLKASPKISLKSESQPSKKKRSRLPKDCQLDASNTEKVVTKKKSQQRQKSCTKSSTKIAPPKKKSATSSHNISRCSPPMTRQRARQISYNQSK